MSKKRASIGYSHLRSSRLQRRLLLESLETRQLLAGDITASVVDGELTLTGDSAANEVFVGDLGDGRFVVRGMADPNGVATTINGQTEVIFEDVTDITANLGGGDDRFVLSAESDWHDGNPFSQGWTNTGFKPLLYGGHGYASLAGRLTVDLGDGNDTAVITASATSGIEVQGGDDAGDDGVFIRTNALRVTQSIQVDLGEGNDYAALSLEGIQDDVHVTTADGNDTVLLAYRTDANLDVDTGAGNDRLYIEGGWISPGQVNPAPANGTDNTLTLLTGTGDDDIDLTQLFASKLVVDSGLGLDDVTIKGININGDVNVRGGGALNSQISITDYNRLATGNIDSILSFFGESYVDTRIGGNLTVNFNAELAAIPAGLNVVTLGQERVTGSATGFTVGGAIQFFGTVYEDMFTVNPLTAASLLVDMGYGEDAVYVRGVTIAGDVAIQLNDGNDRALVLEDAVRYSSGNIVAYSSTQIGGDLRLDFGAGDERTAYPEHGGELTFTFLVGARNTGLAWNFMVLGEAVINTGSGSDDLTVIAAVFRHNLDITFGGDASKLDMDVFNVQQSLSITSNATVADLWTLDAFGIGGSATLHAGSGDADIKIGTDRPLFSNIDGDLWLRTNGGNDQVWLGMEPVNGQAPPAVLSVKGVLQLETAGGDDAVKLFQLRDIDVLLARLGDGDDVLDVFGVEADYGLLDGGRGDADLLGMNGDSYQPRNFEQHDVLIIPASVPLLVRTFN